MRYILIILVLFVQIQACNCSIGKDATKCDYYLLKLHNLKYQQNCLNYAKSIDQDGMYAKSSWYYLLGGDIKSAKSASAKALKMGSHYAAEYKGFVSILDGNMKEAKKELSFFKHKIKKIDYVKKDIETLKSIYKNFDAKTAYEALGIR